VPWKRREKVSVPLVVPRDPRFVVAGDQSCRPCLSRRLVESLSASCFAPQSRLAELDCPVQNCRGCRY
jgi:hypothetical protein